MTLLWSRGQPRWVATFRILAALAMALAAFLIVRGVVLAAGDPAGDATLAADPDAGVDFVWTLTSGALVFFMQAGFALLGAGLIRAKNTVNYLTKNILDFAAAGLSFWAFGYAFMFGGSGLPGMAEGNAFIGFPGSSWCETPTTCRPPASGSSRWSSRPQRPRSWPARWPSAPR